MPGLENSKVSRNFSSTILPWPVVVGVSQRIDQGLPDRLVDLRFPFVEEIGVEVKGQVQVGDQALRQD